MVHAFQRIKVRLYEACLKGSREEIQNYCQNGRITTLNFNDGMTSAHVVAIAGRKDAEVILEMLLQSGIDVNARTKSTEDTVLHLIAEHVDLSEAFPLVLKILEYSPDVKIRNKKLRTPYDIALARGKYELAQILDGNMTPSEARAFYKENVVSQYGWTRRLHSGRTTRYLQGKLVDAVIRSNESEIQDFLKAGADPNYVNEHKNGAIHYAITHCKLPPYHTLTLLLNGGTDPNLQDNEGDTALNLVIKSTSLRASGDMYKCAELLIQRGAMSTFKDLDGNDALSLATKRQYADIIKMLINHRGNQVQPADEIEENDDFAHPPPIPTNQTQMHEIEHEPVNVEEESPTQPVLASPPLAREQPPVYQSWFAPPVIHQETDDDDDDLGPPAVLPQDCLITAVKEGDLQDVNEALFTYGAVPNIQDVDGVFPIHHVCIRGPMKNEEERLDMLRSLIEAKADINVQTVVSKSTALHVAATKNQDQVAKLLLETHKCNYSIKNKDGKTAYDIAQADECIETMAVIDNYRKHIRDRMHRTAKTSTCSIL